MMDVGAFIGARHLCMLHPYLGVKCLTLVFNPKKERAREKEVQVTKILGG